METIGITGLRENPVGMAGLKNPIGDPPYSVERNYGGKKIVHYMRA